MRARATERRSCEREAEGRTHDRRRAFALVIVGPLLIDDERALGAIVVRRKSAAVGLTVGGSPRSIPGRGERHGDGAADVL